MMKGDPYEELQYGPVTAGDGALLAQLLLHERISLAGCVDPALYRAFIEDALHGRGPHIMLVRARGRIVGWSIGVIDSRGYWLSFLREHPATGIRILAGLCLQKYRNRKERKGKSTGIEQNGPELESLPTAGYDHWGRDGSHTARLVDTTILPAFRGAGLGGRLQYHHLRELRKLGIRRAEAYVRADKFEWLHFNARNGFKVAAKKANSVLIVNDLEESLGDGG